MQAHFLPAEARARFAQDRFDAVRRIAHLASAHSCAFVLAAGDLFDSNHVDRRVIAKAIDALSAFTVPVLLLPGNHDPLDQSSVYRSADWMEHAPPNAIVPQQSGTVADLQIDGVEVVAAPWQTKHQLHDPLSDCLQMPPVPHRSVRVIVGHGIVDDLSPSAEDPALIRAERIRDLLSEGAAHYLALGDRHSVTEIAQTGGRAFYSGTPVSTDYGETDPNRVLLVSLDRDRCQVEPQAIGSWTFERVHRELTSDADVDQLIHTLQAMPSKPTTAVKLALQGSLTLAAHAKLEEALERCGETLAALDTWERHTDLIVEPDEADLQALDVSGYVREALQQLRTEAASPGEQAAVARDALNLLYRLAS